MRLTTRHPITRLAPRPTTQKDASAYLSISIVPVQLALKREFLQHIAAAPISAHTLCRRRGGEGGGRLHIICRTRSLHAFDAVCRLFGTPHIFTGQSLRVGFSWGLSRFRCTFFVRYLVWAEWAVIYPTFVNMYRWQKLSKNGADSSPRYNATLISFNQKLLNSRPAPKPHSLI